MSFSSGDQRLNANYIPDIKKYAVGKVGYFVTINSEDIISGFGRNDYGQYKIGDYITGVKQIAAGAYHTVLLFENGTVSGFGRNDYGQATLGNSLTGVTKISAGTYHTLALLSNGRVTGWGQSTVTKAKADVDFPAYYDRATDDVSKAGYTNNLTGVIDICAGDQSSYALLNNNNITGWGVAKWKYKDGLDILEYPINLGPIRKMTASNNFSIFLLDDAEKRALALRHYQTEYNSAKSPIPGVSDIFGSSLDPSFRIISADWSDYSGLILDNYNGFYPLTGIEDISAGIDYTMAIVGTGLVTGWGYEEFNQINFYNKFDLRKPKTIFTGTVTFPVGPAPVVPICYNPSLVNFAKRLTPENTGFYRMTSIEAGWNITAAINSGSGLTIIGDQNEFLYDSDFGLGAYFLNPLYVKDIYINQIPTGHFSPISNKNKYNVQLTTYTGHPSGILKGWPYGTIENPQTGSNIYETPTFEVLYIEDKVTFPKACCFINGLININDWITNLPQTGGSSKYDMTKNISNLDAVKGIYGYIYTGGSPNSGVDNYYFYYMASNANIQSSTNANSLFHSIPCTGWELANFESFTGQAGIIFTRYLSDTEYQNYDEIDNFPQPIEQKQIYGSEYYESDKILLNIGASKNSCGYSIYRKINNTGNYIYLSGVINDIEPQFGNCLDGTIHEIIDYIPEYSNPPFGTNIQYQIYPYNNFGSGDPIFLEARLVQTDC
jgi:alpha-tubulin suppressor-like RCC1 family protein